MQISASEAISATCERPDRPAAAPDCASGGDALDDVMATSGLDDSAPFEWTAHPAHDRPLAAAAAGGAILVFAGALGWSLHSIAWTVIASLVLFASLSRFFLPSSFVLGRDAVVASFPLTVRRLPWAAVRRRAVGSRGIYLGTRSTPSRLDPFRGVELLLPAAMAAEARQELVREIDRRIGADRAAELDR